MKSSSTNSSTNVAFVDNSDKETIKQLRDELNALKKQLTQKDAQIKAQEEFIKNLVKQLPSNFNKQAFFIPASQSNSSSNVVSGSSSSTSSNSSSNPSSSTSSNSTSSTSGQTNREQPSAQREHHHNLENLPYTCHSRTCLTT